MTRRFLRLALLLSLVLALPALAADDKKQVGKDDKTKHVDADTLLPGSYTGKLQDVPGKDGTFTLQVETSRLEAKKPNQPANDANQAMQTSARDEAHIAQLEADLARARTPKEYAHKAQQLEAAFAQLQKQMQQSQAKLANDFKTVVEVKKVDFQLADEVKFRILSLPIEFDDDGKIKTYTAEEKKTRKGKESKLPGYEAKADDLKPGDLLRVTLAKKPAPKKADGDTDKASKDAASKTKNTPDKDPTEKKTQVTVIVILNEDSAAKDKAKNTTPKK